MLKPDGVDGHTHRGDQRTHHAFARATGHRLMALRRSRTSASRLPRAIVVGWRRGARQQRGVRAVGVGYNEGTTYEQDRERSPLGEKERFAERGEDGGRENVDAFKEDLVDDRIETRDGKTEEQVGEGEKERCHAEPISGASREDPRVLRRNSSR